MKAVRDRKVLYKIAKRLIIAVLGLIVTSPLALIWIGITGKKSPFLDPLLDWAIDAPITEYEHANNLERGA